MRVVGVQSEAAPAAYRSWREGRLVEDRMETFAEGLATRTAFELPQRILRESLDDQEAKLAEAELRLAGLPHRRPYLLLTIALGRRLVQAQREWLADVERELLRSS